MTKKEANRLMRQEYGAGWTALDPDREMRDALRAGKAPKARPEQRPARPVHRPSRPARPASTGGYRPRIWESVYGISSDSLTPIMYWSSAHDPNSYVGRAASVAPARVEKAVRKLKRGVPVGRCRGRAPCRICNRQLGSADLSDGVYVWPEGAEHYIEAHGVWFPALSAFARADTSRSRAEMARKLQKHKERAAADLEREMVALFGER